MENKKRIIQESVPGKQITLAHVIANPDPIIFERINLTTTHQDAIGILHMTPRETAMIAADVATKDSGVEIGYVDRFKGSVVMMGSVSAVESAIEAVIDDLVDRLGFKPTSITRT